MSYPEYFDRLIYLETISEIKNAYGELVPNVTASNPVYAMRVAVSRAAEFAAQTDGYRPECAYRIWTRDYHGEEFIKDGETVYRIRRAYSRDGKTELTVSRGLR